MTGVVRCCDLKTEYSPLRISRPGLGTNQIPLQ